MFAAYENTRRVVYGGTNATFVPVCEKCGRYVRADEAVRITMRGWPISLMRHVVGAEERKCYLRGFM